MTAMANEEIYFAQDVSQTKPINQGGPNDVPRPLYPNSQAEAAQFFSRISNRETEDFEEFASDAVPTSLTFGTNVAYLIAGTNDLLVRTIATNVTSDGLFPTSGTNCLRLGYTTGTNDHFFTMMFNNPQSALGFYATDIELNNFSLTVIGANGVTNEIPVPVTVPQGSGGVCFFGLIDKVNPFTTVEFHMLGTQNENFGFDDLTIGVPNQINPGPAILGISATPLSVAVTISGTVGSRYNIDAKEAGEGTNWITLTNTLLPTSPYTYTDTNTPFGSERLYRAVGTQ